MTKKSIEDWEAKKKMLVSEHPSLTEEDLAYEAGKEEELLKRLQKKLDKSESDIRKWLSLMG